MLGARIDRVERRGADRVIVYTVEGARREVACDAILVGAGRAPNVEGLGLEAAGVAFGREGVTVTDHLQTTNRRIYACGDVASRFKFTHMADALARIVLENALFGGWKKASALHVPWCTYTSPEVAHVGLYPAEAEARGLSVDTLTIPSAFAFSTSPPPDGARKTRTRATTAPTDSANTEIHGLALSAAAFRSRN